MSSTSGVASRRGILSREGQIAARAPSISDFPRRSGPSRSGGREGARGRGWRRVPSPNPSGWSRPGRPPSVACPRPGSPRRRPRVSVVIGERPEPDRSTPRPARVRRNPSGLPIPQNAATRRPARSLQGVDAPAASIRSSGACRASAQRSGPACRSARARIARRVGSSTRSARERTTTPARRSDPTGSRSNPRGKIRPRPNGSRASRRTTSRSRASRRCWKPSSRTRTSLASSSSASFASATRSRPCRCGTSGRFSSRTRPSSFRPVLAASPYPRLRIATRRSRARNQRAIHSTASASCPSRPGSGSRPRRPGCPPGASPSTPVEGQIPRPHPEAIARRDPAQPEPGQRSQRAPRLAPDQPEELRLVDPGHDRKSSGFKRTRTGPDGSTGPPAPHR